MTTYINFPGQSPEVAKTPVWATRKNISRSGRRRAIQLYSSPIWRFELSFEVLRKGFPYYEVEDLLGIFNTCMGATDTFTFIDPTDFAVSGQFFANGNGASQQFQLIRTVAGYGAQFVETISRPIGTPDVFIDGVQTAAFGIDASTGILTFSSPPANGAVLTWTGMFGYLCAFEEDELDLRRMMSTLYDLGRLRFQSVKQ